MGTLKTTVVNTCCPVLRRLPVVDHVSCQQAPRCDKWPHYLKPQADILVTSDQLTSPRTHYLIFIIKTTKFITLLSPQADILVTSDQLASTIPPGDDGLEDPSKAHSPMNIGFMFFRCANKTLYNMWEEE